MKKVEISSSENASVKRIKRILQSSRFMKKEGKTVAEGIHLTGEILAKKPELLVAVYLRRGSEENAEVKEILDKLRGTDVPLYIVSPGVFNEISPVENSQGILSEISIPTASELRLESDAVYLDGVQDPGNVGTIIRAAVASSVKNIILSDKCANVWSAKVLRAGMGAHFSCNLFSDVSIEDLKEKCDFEFLVADARGGKDLYKEEWGEKNTVWVFGSEGLGVSHEALAAADKVLLIPINHEVESLNVAMAATVCLFEQVRRRQER